VLVSIDGSVIVAVLIGRFYFFLKLLNADISENLEILGLAPRDVRWLVQD
jgi:hypothetical protein